MIGGSTVFNADGVEGKTARSCFFPSFLLGQCDDHGLNGEVANRFGKRQESIVALASREGRI